MTASSRKQLINKFLSFCVLQMLIAGAVCTTEEVQLQSACSNKFIQVKHDGKIFANDSSEYPRKFSCAFFHLYFIYCLHVRPKLCINELLRECEEKNA